MGCPLFPKRSVSLQQTILGKVVLHAYPISDRLIFLQCIRRLSILIATFGHLRLPLSLLPFTLLLTLGNFVVLLVALGFTSEV